MMKDTLSKVVHMHYGDVVIDISTKERYTLEIIVIMNILGI